jgi:microcystin-dependent protein
MIELYTGTMLLVPYNIVPDGWVECNGQTLQIADNQALFALMGPKYGGDGIQNFKVPDMGEAKDANGNPLKWIMYLYGLFPPPPQQSAGR